MGLGDSIKEVYRKVVKKFPEIDEKDVSITFDFFAGYVAFTSIDAKKFILNGEVVVKPTLYVGPNFFLLSDREMEMAIAHELGHYKRERGYSNNVLRRKTNFIKTMHNYSSMHLEDYLCACKKEGHKIERLKKWNMLNELYADNEAVRAGYYKELLSFLEDMVREYDHCYGGVHPMYTGLLKDRIKNLKRKKRT
ncbi:MAG: hypothetical protein Q8N77_03625 [Nanoarchaeota archaeon]|nr:hypothetical protein [Nanoarchaeota archaeon]